MTLAVGVGGILTTVFEGCAGQKSIPGVQSTCLLIKQGTEMITMDMLGKVRRMKMRDNLSISEIAKRTGLARNTIRGWLRAPGEVIPKYERRSDPRKITEYEAGLIMALKADGLRHKDSRPEQASFEMAAPPYRLARIGMCFQPMVRDIDSACDPDILFG